MCADSPTPAWKRWIGVGLILLAGVFFAGMFLVGLLPFSVGVRGGLAFACFILMEVSFWLGTLIIGKQAVSAWWRRLRNKSPASAESETETETEKSDSDAVDADGKKE